MDKNAFYGMTLDEEQVAFVKAIKDKNKVIVFCDAAAGTGKTTLAMGAANILVKNSNVDEVIAFMNAQQEAEAEGREEFTCPLCGGTAIWGRARGNNHLHCGCKGCGFRMME